MYRHTDVPASEKLMMSGSPSHSLLELLEPEVGERGVQGATGAEEVQEREADGDTVDEVREEQDALEEVPEPRAKRQDGREVQRESQWMNDAKK
ncbi:hypothetical protein GCM10025876_38610 [Demequina litorisediminis]|uniref:Uncharacterized protein n=1 Tax=Demequina litorisediminis TaxID=1849022 RepID=A0ABQ6ILN9_9MICO|nr:hypothetical protein GCM10025876_38610 [Demequina litorisediminis]